MSDADADPMIVLARRAKANAHAPYSNFPVGAAVEAGGRVYTGCNIENASYGLAVCAERVAIFTAVAAGARRIDRLAVSTSADPGAPGPALMPCGACRQVMAEFMAPDAEILVDGAGRFTLADLLPRPFRLD